MEMGGMAPARPPRRCALLTLLPSPLPQMADTVVHRAAHDHVQTLHKQKARFRMEEPQCSPVLRPDADSGDDTRELPARIEKFPTTNQPVIDTVLKDMLLSLRSTIQADMMFCMNKFHKDIQAVDTRVEHIETKMGEYATTINDLVDAQEQGEDELEDVKAKLADLEDRSWRNNLKIRGVSESVQQSELNAYAASMFSELLPDLTAIDITIDRIHRLPKPSYLPDNIPRDVILRLHFFHVKEQLMAVMRSKDHIPPNYQHLQFYDDLSQYTLKKNLQSAMIPTLEKHLCCFSFLGQKGKKKFGYCLLGFQF